MRKVILFGKLPFHGDFVSRNLTGAEQRRLDVWLAASMASARQILEDRFCDLFDSAPPWQFAWEDSKWTSGAIAPSVDRTGRRFPVLVGVSGIGKPEAAACGEVCEEVLFDAIANLRSADEVVDDLSSGAFEARDSDVIEGWWSRDAGGQRLSQRFPADLLENMMTGSSGTVA